MKNKKLIFLGMLLILVGYFLYPIRSFEGVLTNEIYLCPNDRQILYVYEKEGASSIYTFNIGDGEAKLLLRKEGYYLSEPSFLEDGKKIIYRAWKKNDPKITIFIANSDGSNPIEVYKNKYLFTPKFSKYNSNQIFFVRASKYSNHSPIATQHANGMDFYSYNLKTKVVKKHTQDNYYNINSFDFIDMNNFVVNCNLTGIFKYRLGSLKKEELIVKDKIDSSYADQIYGSRISFSMEDEKFLLSTYFDVYLWDGKASKLNSIYSSEPGNQIEFTSFFRNKKHILVSTHNETISTIDYNGRVVNRFKIPHPKK